ncbi:hypothetical protein Y88_1155 [Novosphingobium nitrogenifigens DSM 19370]|uniref:Uncharacterized protein n=1 Tax=Novosphingobium nitrogenifigens DSM 19370 TaxID=983920 RepID=F1Z8D3_9SPHN|nr:hypothetical protein Y88_1155 [Novosphingobium nitrogenifigens DSM 19370]
MSACPLHPDHRLPLILPATPFVAFVIVREMGHVDHMDRILNDGCIT